MGCEDFVYVNFVINFHCFYVFCPRLMKFKASTVKETTGRLEVSPCISRIHFCFNLVDLRSKFRS
jgi:hypothetical protein